MHYPYVREMNLNTKYGDISKMGTIIECENDNEPTFILAYICKGYPYHKNGTLPDFLSYDSLEKCLKLINIKYKNKKIACPLIGCSRFDGNGDKNIVLDMMQKHLTNVDLYVYDYEQETRAEKLKKWYVEEKKLKDIDYEAYRQAVKKRKEEADKRYAKNGFARY